MKVLRFILVWLFWVGLIPEPQALVHHRAQLGRVQESRFGATYATIVTPGYENIQGVARADQWVTVNSGDSDRKGEYFHREVSVSNSGGPLWQSATISCGGVSSNGGFVFPKNSQSFTYDNDGNLTFDGVWTYQWDAENRLVTMAMTNVSGIANANRYKLDFAYDYMGRRVQKAVATWAGSAFGTATNTRFVYDGWNLIAELDSSTNILRSYLWGIDLSGNMQDAGGIGGLLLMVDHVPATDAYHFPCYDGNGNLMGLVNASDQSISARYEYSPYGEVLRAVGSMASSNPYTYQTKFADAQSTFPYFGRRFYNPMLGRWLNRDSIEENGGVNLCAFLNNRPIGAIDPIGNIGGLLDVLLVNTGDAGRKLIELKRGETLVSRVRNAVQTLDNLQQFEAGVHEAQGLDITDLIDSIGAARRGLSQNLRGAKSGMKAAAIVDDMHHIFPKAKSLMAFFRRNQLNPDEALIAFNGFMHRFGMHDITKGKGGPYNEIWHEFQRKNKTMKNNPYYVIGFGVGLFDRISPLLL